VEQLTSKKAVETVTKEILVRVRDHLLKQNERSILPGSKHKCAYRGQRGLACAIGCLIVDPYYNKDLENLPASAEKVERAVADSLGINKSSIYKGGNMDMRLVRVLADLQSIHDNFEVTEWEYKLMGQFERYGVPWS
jgi:hypothetical protein